MLFRPLAKTYVSRGTQTGDNTPHSQFQSLCETQSQAPLTANDTSNCERGKDHQGAESSDDFRGQLLGTLAYENAYIRSKGSESSELLPLLSYKVKRYAGVGVNRRPLSVSSQKRVVSLPDAPLAPKIEVLTEGNTRIVSMPEFTQYTSSDHTAFYQMNTSFSSDGGQSRNKSTNSPTQQWQLGRDRNYPSDLPRTPSPPSSPSSPDSIVIIGNEPHVSGSFLRRPSVDDDGWITWANSPPRPIPALHGPLSLPYARCPSGAEGTVTEGDDLTHKIWGLGVGDSHVHAAPYTKRSQTQQQSHFLSNVNYHVESAKPLKEFHQDVQCTTPLQRQGDAIIDLSRPSTFYGGNEPNPNTFNSLNVNLFGKSLFSTSASRETQNTPPSDGLRIGHGTVPLRDYRGWLTNTVTLTNSHPFNPLDFLDAGWKRPAISEQQVERDARSFGGNGQNRLNKSAPVFVPGSDWQPQDTFTRYERDGSFPVDVRNSRQIELSQSRRNEFNSPNWSPTFPYPLGAHVPNLMTPRHVQDTTLCADPGIYSPTVEGEEYSSKLMAMIQQFKNQELLSVAKNSPGESTALVGRKGPPPIGRMEQIQVVDTSGPIHVASDTRRDLAQQRPRSIPLARLIQRRLSSVPEEVGTGHNSISSTETRFSKDFLSPEPYSRQPSVLHPDVKSFAGIGPEGDVLQTPEILESPEENGESNAIVRLPRKSSNSPGFMRSSSGPARCQGPLRDASKTDRCSTTSENKGATGTGFTKGRTSKGKAKKKESDPAKDASE